MLDDSTTSDRIIRLSLSLMTWLAALPVGAATLQSSAPSIMSITATHGSTHDEDIVSQSPTASDRTSAWICNIGHDQLSDRIEELSIADDEDFITSADSESLEPGALSVTKYNGFWDSVTNKTLHPDHPDDTANWLKRFERGGDADLRIYQTYERSQIIPADVRAPCPTVDLVFLPGADKPTVTRLEGLRMMEKYPDQRNSIWRANTAGTLLSYVTVDSNLSLITEDRTRIVIDRIRQHESPSCDHAEKVTIDSSRVSIATQLRDENGHIKANLAATLIEVDANSLVKLITHFHNLLKEATPNMVPVHHGKHLGDMMDDARTFYTRSPVLFRMSTRPSIINSADIRYGHDDQEGFRTIYPSKGIQQLVQVTASYFNALDPAGAPLQEDNTQALVRSRFLQILVFLLSMLSSSEVKQLAPFLESTYGIRSTRTELELLFIKTIPLASINTKVFLSALVPSISGHQVPAEAFDDEEQIWQALMMELAGLGYLLPATVDDLGHEKHSWVPRWPKDGVRSSHIFSRMQLAGKTLKGFNEILPINLGGDSNAKEMTIYLHNLEMPYTIDTQDYEAIQCLRQGHYILREGEEGGRDVELRISAQPLNTWANKAINLINSAVPEINAAWSRPRPSKSKRLVKFSSGRSTQDGVLTVVREMPVESTITRHEAWFENVEPYLAVSWQCDGKAINKREMITRMFRCWSRIHAWLRSLDQKTNGFFGRHNPQYEQVITYLDQHELLMRQERDGQTLTAHDTPICRTIFPNDEPYGVPDIWFEYESNYVGCEEHLFITSERGIVKSVRWIANGTQAEVELLENRIKFVVQPLRPELGLSTEEAIQQGDLALLCGRYMVVVVQAIRTPPASYCGETVFELTNWLEIHSIGQQAQTRRGSNRKKAPTTSRTVIV